MRLKRPCRKCGKTFVPKTRNERVCGDCKKEIASKKRYTPKDERGKFKPKAETEKP